MNDLRTAAQQALDYWEQVAWGDAVMVDKMAALRAALAQQAEPVGTRALIEECLAAFAQELAAWDIDPPLHHVKQAHDKCEAWLAALAQQAEPVAAERERCAEYLMQQAAECRENSPTRVTLESCAAVLRLGLHAQAEPVEPTAWVGDPSTQDYASTVPDPQIEDRLARHGIPMPEGNPK